MPPKRNKDDKTVTSNISKLGKVPFIPTENEITRQYQDAVVRKAFYHNYPKKQRLDEVKRERNNLIK